MSRLRLLSRLSFHPSSLLLVLLIAGASAGAQDMFAAVKCGADVPKAIIGKRDKNEPVDVTEKRHKDLGLKGLGGDEISDRLFLGYWRMCGKEYALLEDTKAGLVLDALELPLDSTKAPIFDGYCSAGGKPTSSVIVAVLDNSAGIDVRSDNLPDKTLKPISAWRIDESKKKFAQQPTDNLECPLSGVVTRGGGK